MSKVKLKSLKEYLAEIGTKGGKVKSAAKTKALSKNLEKARIALKKKREKK